MSINVLHGREIALDRLQSARLIFRYFFFNDTATTEIYTLSLHDALPIHARQRGDACALIKHAGTNADESVGMGEIADEHTDQAPPSGRTPGRHGDRAPGQYAHAPVRRLRRQPLPVLGALALATALIGRP